MCGIALLYDPGESAARTQMVRAALKRLSHRGPDDQGFWAGDNIVLAHRRLAIIDLTHSRQPMVDEWGRYALVYNGEIYNFRDLRRRLQARWKFRTDGDTEVVLAGLVLEGPEFVRCMEGMWALALWDTKLQTLLLSRDRMGKKPLYYEIHSDGFACASELPALASLTRKPWQEDPDSTADYLRYGYYLPGYTAYKNVYEVLPGHNLVWSPRGPTQQQPYWSLSTQKRAISDPSVAATRLQEVLVSAVKRRLVADVEVGEFLSGGIDSSLITGITSRLLRRTTRTFTIGFRDQAYDERSYAARISALFDTQHTEECLEHWDRHTLLDLIVKNVGQPFSDSSLLPTALVSHLAANHVKVALSGDGGDELFSGYQRYQARNLLRWYTRLPSLLRRNVTRLIRSFPEPTAHHSRSMLKKAHLFIDVTERQACEEPYVAPLLYTNEHYARFAPQLQNRGHKPPKLPDETQLDSLQEMMFADTLVYLPQDILVKVDRASMAYSLEVRAPFLDREVVELAFSVPRLWHRDWWRGKRLLERAFPDLLPRGVWRRRKQGFAVPVHSWFRDQLGDELMKMLEIDRDIPFERSFVADLLRAHRAQQRDHGYRLWNIYVYLVWKDLWKRGEF